MFKQVLVASALALAAVCAQAQELKIGYVNSERVLKESAPAKAALARLTAEFEKRRLDLVDQEAKIKASAAKLDKDLPTLSPSERNRRETEQVNMEREFKRKAEDFQADMGGRRNQEMASIVERANAVLKQIYEGEKYDLILQDVVFAGPRVDITDKVIKALNNATR